MGRVIARATESELVLRRLDSWLDELERNIHAGDLRIADTAKWDPSTLAEPGAGLRCPRGAARRARPLGGDLRRHHLALSGGRADHVERLPARRSGPPGSLRAGARGDAGRRSRSGRSSCCAPCTRSIPAWPAPCHVLQRGRLTGRGVASRPATARARSTSWELPVRIVHWTIVLALIVLSFTGYYIHHPFLGRRRRDRAPRLHDGDRPIHPRGHGLRLHRGGAVPDLLGVRRQPLRALARAAADHRCAAAATCAT